MGPIDSTPRIRSLVGRYLEDELHQAERILTLYRPWKRVLQALREYLSASRADPFGERVDGGGRGVPVAQRIVEAQEGDREFDLQRVMSPLCGNTSPLCGAMGKR